MRYWWANQMSAYDAEVAGGYLWSRKRRSDGSRNPFYDSLTLTQPGDIIFGYHRTAIRAVGFVLEPVAEAPCPAAGPPPAAEADAELGWLLHVSWLELQRPLVPAEHMEILAPLLPPYNSPLTEKGRGIQGGRLVEVHAYSRTAGAGLRTPWQLLCPSEGAADAFHFSEMARRSAPALPSPTPDEDS